MFDFKVKENKQCSWKLVLVFSSDFQIDENGNAETVRETNSGKDRQIDNKAELENDSICMIYFNKMFSLNPIKSNPNRRVS